MLKTYSLSKVRQLIDLNGDSTNFEINFKIATKNKEPFDMLIADQTTLDNNPNLDYKNASNGEISGTVVQDKNIYQNYFLVLKSNSPCECVVEIAKKELPKSVPIQAPPVLSKKEESSFPWLLVILLIGGGVLLWYFFMRKKEEVVVASFSSPNISKHNSPPNSPPHRMQLPPQPQNPLLHRLKKLNIP